MYTFEASILAMESLDNYSFFERFYSVFKENFPFLETENGDFSCLAEAVKVSLRMRVLSAGRAGEEVSFVCIPLSFYRCGAADRGENMPEDDLIAYTQCVSVAIHDAARSSFGVAEDAAAKTGKWFYVYEDVFMHDPQELMSRIALMLGQGRRIFARNCTVQRIDPNIGRDFLERHHSYGHAKAKYYYGLFLKRRGRELQEDCHLETGTLVAVASFSLPRKMKYEDGRSSSEWVRYSALGGYRIVGGMSMLLGFFMEDRTPDEVVSYADLEWSQGDSYMKLGFVPVSYRTPVPFVVDNGTFRRIHYSRFVRGDKTDACDFRYGCSIISNMGSLKLVLRHHLSK